MMLTSTKMRRKLLVCRLKQKLKADAVVVLAADVVAVLRAVAEPEAVLLSVEPAAVVLVRVADNADPAEEDN
jgi:hypothetical protein